MTPPTAQKKKSGGGTLPLLRALLESGRAADLSSVAFRAYVALAFHADSDFRCYPSLTRIAKMSGVSRRNLLRGLLELESIGSIRRRPGRLKVTTRYKMNSTWWKPIAEEEYGQKDSGDHGDDMEEIPF